MLSGSRCAIRDTRIEQAEQFSTDDDDDEIAGADKLVNTSSAAKFIWMLTGLGFSNSAIAAQAIVEFSKVDDADWAQAGLWFAKSTLREIDEDCLPVWWAHGLTGL